jgi:hypothetical protein
MSLFVRLRPILLYGLSQLPCQVFLSGETLDYKSDVLMSVFLIAVTVRPLASVRSCIVPTR